MSAYITFIDYSKAFDSVIHSFLMDIMQTMGFPRHITSLIVSLYKTQKATIRCNGDNCEPFNIEKGVRQGCILSSHLFNINTEHIMRHADVESLGVNLGGGDITNLRYADDAALLSDNVVVVVVVDPKLLSSSLLYSQCQADESACLLQLV